KREPLIDSTDEIDFGLHADNDRISSKNRQAVQGALKLDDPQVPTLLNPFDDGDEEFAAETEEEAADYEEILIIHVVARNEEGFKGPALLQSILESGLRFGAMDIFHRHESITGNGDKLFS